MAQPHKRWILEQLATSPFVARGPIGFAWRYVSRDVWLVDLERQPWWRRVPLRACRILFLTLRSFVGDRCVLQAGSLTYVTVLSLVPLLAFAFAMLKGLGFYEDLRQERIDPFLDQLFQARAAVVEPPALADAFRNNLIELPLAPPIAVEPAAAAVSVAAPQAGASELRHGIERVFDFVDQTNLKALGSVGLVVLLLAVLRLLGSIENSFNEIWGVRKSRSWVRKLSDYLTMVVATPIFLVVAIGVTTAAQNAGLVTFLREELSLGFALEALFKTLPVLVGWLAFTLIYLVMPNRRGKLPSALIGGLVGGTLWQLVLVLHIRFQVGIANYNAIYAGFAALPIFLVWIQTSWVIVLLGAEVAFAHESEPDYRGIAAYQAHGHAFKEQVALRALTRICDAFLAGDRPASASSIAVQLGISPREVQETLEELQRGGLIAVVEGASADASQLVPARDPGRITIVEVLAVLRGKGQDESVVALGALDTKVDRLLAKLDEEARGSAYNRTLRELVEEARREAEAGEASVAAARVQPL